MTYEVKIEKGKIYSFIRDKWLELTPEEQVRQKFVCHLIEHYGYQLTNHIKKLKTDGLPIIHIESMLVQSV